jgi:hypothetical protein
MKARIVEHLGQSAIILPALVREEEHRGEGQSDRDRGT